MSKYVESRLQDEGAQERRMAIDERQFRDALGMFATGVAVIAAEVDGAKLAATVSSFNAVSLSPPLVLFSLGRKALSFEQWLKAKSFAVMVLDQDQADLSSRFAKAGTDKWAGLPSNRGVRTGAPLLSEFIVAFECSVYARYDGGDHEIIVGQVLDLVIKGASTTPLIFYRGRYRQLNVEGTEAVISPDPWLYGW
jgi:flavin reductase (DIM6/NTAB) family NADH-FMN oxidoreductase RutF